MNASYHLEGVIASEEEQLSRDVPVGLRFRAGGVPLRYAEGRANSRGRGLSISRLTSLSHCRYGATLSAIPANSSRVSGRDLMILLQPSVEGG